MPPGACRKPVTALPSPSTARSSRSTVPSAARADRADLAGCQAPAASRCAACATPVPRAVEPHATTGTPVVVIAATGAAARRSRRRRRPPPRPSRRRPAPRPMRSPSAPLCCHTASLRAVRPAATSRQSAATLRQYATIVGSVGDRRGAPRGAGAGRAIGAAHCSRAACRPRCSWSPRPTRRCSRAPGPAVDREPVIQVRRGTDAAPARPTGRRAAGRAAQMQSAGVAGRAGRRRPRCRPVPTANAVGLPVKDRARDGRTPRRRSSRPALGRGAGARRASRSRSTITLPSPPASSPSMQRSRRSDVLIVAGPRSSPAGWRAQRADARRPGTGSRRRPSPDRHELAVRRRHRDARSAAGRRPRASRSSSRARPTAAARRGRSET